MIQILFALQTFLSGGRACWRDDCSGLLLPEAEAQQQSDSSLDSTDSPLWYIFSLVSHMASERTEA